MSSSSSGVKRARTDDPLASAVSTPQTIPPSSTSNVTASSAFRNVSACNRCRQRKNRCDQNLPSCSSCEKARVKCVGFDPITKREIPRTYVYYLESRVSYLETLLANNGIPYATSEDFDLGAKPSSEQSQSQSPSDLLGTSSPGTVGKNRAGWDAVGQSRETWNQVQDDERQLNRLVSNIGMVSVQGASDPRYLGSTSGISFARYAA
ncbi:MAG: hypothetical protein LQ338_001117 [Usnochroma carphineum]|nr:MAG: hypothetical protein LQ338_001117 [Usnochroma carphineum]